MSTPMIAITTRSSIRVNPSHLRGLTGSLREQVENDRENRLQAWGPTAKVGGRTLRNRRFRAAWGRRALPERPCADPGTPHLPWSFGAGRLAGEFCK
jgi:hypothetical protein